VGKGVTGYLMAGLVQGQKVILFMLGAVFKGLPSMATTHVKGTLDFSAL
jgi:hypothetical protein